jgi:hypothetical protein
MELSLSFNSRKQNVLQANYTGTSEQVLGLIEPEKHKDFKLTIFPTNLGIVSIKGLILNDFFMKRAYEFDDFLQVFVVNDLNEPYDMQKCIKYHETFPIRQNA